MPVAVPPKRCFEALDLNPDHTNLEEVRIAYKKLVRCYCSCLSIHHTQSLFQALKWHPDRHNVDKEEAQQKFVEVRRVLSLITRCTISHDVRRIRSTMHTKRCCISMSTKSLSILLRRASRPSPLQRGQPRLRAALRHRRALGRRHRLLLPKRVLESTNITNHMRE